MDSNGRHRPSASTSSSSTSPAPVPLLSGSSTFRRLPSLARPFRRNPDKDKEKERDRAKGKEEAIAEEDVGSAPPTPDQRPSNEPTSTSTSTPLWPPSRTSSLLPSSGSPAPAPPADSHPPLSPFQPKESMREAMVATVAPPVPVLSSQGLDDMEHITYPAHLAQRQAPGAEAGPGPSSSSASTPINAVSPPPLATPIAIRAISRPRGDTLGTPIQAIRQREASGSRTAQITPPTNGIREELGPEPGPGGPPTGVPRRKESIVAAAAEASHENGTADARRDGPSKVSRNGGAIKGDSEHDTDSGGVDASTARRRRAGTTGRPRDITPKDQMSTPTSAEKDTAAARIRKASRTAVASSSTNTPVSSTPARPSLPAAKGISRVPASAMYFSLVSHHGRPPGQPLRAHTGTLIGDRIWVIGGVDAKNCWRGVAWYDTDSLLWTTVETTGETLPPLRAHTTTAVGDKLYIFGGGDGPTYSNEVWCFDTSTHRFHKPEMGTDLMSLPPPRRAHTTVLYRNYLVVFGGGNGQNALNDVWALDISDPSRLTWQEWPTKGDVPQRKGYHTANLVGDKMVVFGGSDGHASFADVHILNLKTLTWTAINTDVKYNRLSHTSTQVGSYLFILGGHNGQGYDQSVLLFNLVTLQWEAKIPRGQPPPGRGYHVAILHDARIFISGGYNGVSVFDDLWALDLSAAAYLPQVTTFEVDETGGMGQTDL